jgi:cellulose synthase (UDP-forming)
MLALGTWVSSTALAAVVLGIQWLVLPFADPRRTLWRCLMLGGAMALAWRYMVWRFTDTLAPTGWTPDFLIGLAFAVLEALTVLSSSIAFVIHP